MSGGQDGDARKDHDVLERLRSGEMRLRGRIPWSSNATFLVEVGPAGHGLGVAGPEGELDAGSGTVTDAGQCLGIYKPERGERPLADFPPGLSSREVAAYELSTALGFDLVPPTVTRDGPYGLGSVQLFIDADFSEHYFTLFEHGHHHDALVRLAAFDVIANNADRKAGHCLAGPDGKIWGIDNGLCFHSSPKLRTVIWDYAGVALGHELLACIASAFEGSSRAIEQLSPLLSEKEVCAVATRARALLAQPTLPAPNPEERCYPWPLI
ncbi:MAG: SCO1664 family protein [Acidimicrobiales bacterium]